MHQVSNSQVRTHLWYAFWINISFLFVEIWGGIYTNSLALLSDAGHMLTDVSALGLTIFVSKLAERPRDNRKSFGYMRIEVIGAFINGALLVVICGYIMCETIQRMYNPIEIKGFELTIIAFLGLAANGISAYFLRKDIHNNLNVKGAFLHLIMDALGSMGAIISGIVIWKWQWYPVDMLASLFIVILILIGSRNLLKRSINFLMDAVPDHIDYKIVESAIVNLPHVKNVHDLHIWSISEGNTALSAHLIVTENCSSTQHWPECLHETQEMLKNKYNIHHSTIQIEPFNYKPHETC